jgi:chorismate lyase / 3-hydroxybenzoate synthase
MSAAPVSDHPPAAPRLRVGYAASALDGLLAQPDVLAVLGFGRAAPARHDDPRYLRVDLEPLALTGPAEDAPPFEVWRAHAGIRHGREDGLQWASDGQLLFGALEVDEAAVGGIEAASELAYRRLLDFCQARGHASPLRLWNYIDAIIEGDGDAERYRRFNLGRAAGMGGRLAQFSAATAIGRHDGSRRLQVYWLAAREAGHGIENPRQVSAFLYPRQYGPQAPSFARATLPAGETLPLLVSGTASVVGHASMHPGDLLAQLDETLRNIDSLIAAARLRRPALGPALGGDSVLKVYVRHRADADAVAGALAERLPAGTPWLLLHAEVCRRELLVEIDTVHR